MGSGRCECHSHSDPKLASTAPLCYVPAPMTSRVMRIMRARSSTVTLLLVVSLAASARATPPTLAERARTFAERFGPAVQITWNAQRTAPRRLSGLRVATTGADAGERARHFLAAHGELVGIAGDARVDEVRAVALPDRAAARLHTVRLTPRWRGLPIDGRSLVVRLDDEGHVTSLAGELGPLVVPEPGRELDASAITAIVTATYEIVAASPPERVVYARGSAGRVAWRVAVSVAPLMGYFHVWLDAGSGEVLAEAPAAFDQALTELPRREEVRP